MPSDSDDDQNRNETQNVIQPQTGPQQSEQPPAGFVDAAPSTSDNLIANQTNSNNDDQQSSSSVSASTSTSESVGQSMSNNNEEPSASNLQNQQEEPAAPNDNNVSNGMRYNGNLELVNEVFNEPVIDLEAEEFRRRFFEAIARRNAHHQEYPPEYEEFDEDDNIDLIEQIIGDGEATTTSSGVTPERENRDFDSDDNTPGDLEDGSVVPSFDLQLPSRHAYLGEGMEALSGRTILEGDAIAEIPLVLLEFHLVPGQTLPLTVFHSVTQSALLRCVPQNRHFGIVNSGLNDVNVRSPLPRRALGTTAEIYEFQEERQPSVDGRSRSHPSVNIKAKGRHRFNVLSTYRQSDGHLMAKVKIRPEISLPDPWQLIMSSADRHIFLSSTSPVVVLPEGIDDNVFEEHDQSFGQEVKSPLVFASSSTGAQESNKETCNTKGVPACANSTGTTENTIAGISTDNNHGDSDNNMPGPSSSMRHSGSHSTSQMLRRGSESLPFSSDLRRKRTKYYCAMTGWPHFVYEQFDEDVLVKRIHEKLVKDLNALAALSSIPWDATELSFWLAQNLTMSDSLRLQMLKMDTPIERLRFALRLLDKVSRVIECSQCHGIVANHNDIFPMSIEGPQGTYVNPSGFVHELITVTKIRGIIHRGLPSTEASWFPGYAWKIINCRICSFHIGWKFEAVGRLKPSKFWGLAKRSINFKYDFSIENDCPDLDAPPAPPEEGQPSDSNERTPTNSVSSQTTRGRVRESQSAVHLV